MDPSNVRVQLVAGGKWSTRKRVLVFGCGGFFALLLLSCVGVPLVAIRLLSEPTCEGERFYPVAGPGRPAPDNLLVLRADLEDPGVAEALPRIARELTSSAFS